MQNMNYYYDFSGQKFNHPLSLSINSFDRKVFSRQTSLDQFPETITDSSTTEKRIY